METQYVTNYSLTVFSSAFDAVPNRLHIRKLLGNHFVEGILILPINSLGTPAEAQNTMSWDKPYSHGVMRQAAGGC